MINSMQGHEARDNPHSLHDKIKDLEAELMLAKAINRKLLDKIEALNLDLGLKEKQTWQD